ncbi:MAG: endolytic transglycosylase MltG [Treponema sp.]|nr:endolytic transglycosylase MltG [Treponema sp.]
MIFITVLIALFLMLTPVLLGAFMYFNAPAVPKEESVISDLRISPPDGITKTDDGAYYIEIRKGESAQSVGRRLERAGLIKNRYFWNLICRFNKEQIKTGTYRIEIPASQIAIRRIFVLGRQILYRVTIPEGVTLKKTAAILEEAGICSAQDFLDAAKEPSVLARYGIPNATMEGYLFPDTYLFPSEYPAERVIISMANTFFEKIKKVEPSFISLTHAEFNEKVVLASIIEREYRVESEAPLMAGVFYNRLNIGMALQSCATVEYIITEIQDKPHPPVLFNRDLEIRSPYNTYLVPGLPPGPISAPGEVALKAAFFPEKTGYFYFRLEDPKSGRHYFSATLDEHIKAGQLVPKGRL